MLHRINITQGNLVLFDTFVLAIPTSLNTLDLILDPGHLTFAV